MRLQILLLPIAVGWSLCCPAQTLINATGAFLVQPDRMIEYSVGEIAVTTLQSGANVLTQGLLQPTYHISTLVHEAFDSQYTIKCWPNPVGGLLNIETDYSDFQTVRIFNISGHNVLEMPFSTQPILLTELPVGTYFLHLQSAQFLKTIKIIKQ